MTLSQGNKLDSRQAADVSEIVNSCNQFAFDLYERLSDAADGNLFFSPVSISMALAMTYAGAEGETAREMTETLHFTLPQQRLHKAFQNLCANTRTGGVELRIANRLWGQRGYHFLSDFLETTDRCYGAKLADVDFRNAVEDARHQINAWVEQQTNNKIKDLIQPAGLNDMTRLVLVNAIYFLGSWKNEFQEELTKDSPFWTTPDKKLDVVTMRQTAPFRYGEFDNLQILEMPYRSHTIKMQDCPDGTGYEVVEVPESGSDFSMCIFLPSKEAGRNILINCLNSDTCSRLNQLQYCEVDVSLPKFRIEERFKLKDTLQALGMQKAFSINQADFTRMTDDSEGIYLNEAIHQAFVDVNEKGTEAAAATAVMMAGAGMMESEPPKVFQANHPFLFLIRDTATGLIHFMGRLINPTACG